MAQQRGERIDLNRASREELLLVPGVSERVAREILRYRDSHGGFEEVRELDNLWRIPREQLDQIAEHFRV